MFHYVLHNFTEISKYCTDLLQLSYEDLVAITSSDILNVKSEEIVWETILAWLNYDVEHRKRYIVDLLKCVRHGLLDTQYFLERVSYHLTDRSVTNRDLFMEWNVVCYGTNWIEVLESTQCI